MGLSGSRSQDDLLLRIASALRLTGRWMQVGLLQQLVSLLLLRCEVLAFSTELRRLIGRLAMFRAVWSHRVGDVLLFQAGLL